MVLRRGGKYCEEGDEAVQNVIGLAFIGNKGALIKGSQYSKAARLHSGEGGGGGGENPLQKTQEELNGKMEVRGD